MSYKVKLFVVKSHLNDDDDPIVIVGEELATVNLSKVGTGPLQELIDSSRPLSHEPIWGVRVGDNLVSHDVSGKHLSVMQVDDVIRALLEEDAYRRFHWTMGLLTSLRASFPVDFHQDNIVVIAHRYEKVE